MPLTASENELDLPSSLDTGLSREWHVQGNYNFKMGPESEMSSRVLQLRGESLRNEQMRTMMKGERVMNESEIDAPVNGFLGYIQYVMGKAGLVQLQNLFIAHCQICFDL